MRCVRDRRVCTREQCCCINLKSKGGAGRKKRQAHQQAIELSTQCLAKHAHLSGTFLTEQTLYTAFCAEWNIRIFQYLSSDFFAKEEGESLACLPQDTFKGSGVPGGIDRHAAVDHLLLPACAWGPWHCICCSFIDIFLRKLPCESRRTHDEDVQAPASHCP